MNVKYLYPTLLLSIVFSMACLSVSAGTEPHAGSPTPELLNLPGVTRLSINQPAGLMFGSWAWSPDSTRIAISYYRTPVDLSSPLTSRYEIHVLTISSGELQLV